MTHPKSDIPADIRKQAWDIYFKRCDEASRLAAEFEEEEVVDLLALAIMAATEARANEILHAVLDCPHEIEGAEIRLRLSARQQGNATSQLHGRIAAALRKRGEVNTAHNNKIVEA